MSDTQGWGCRPSKYITATPYETVHSSFGFIVYREMVTLSPGKGRDNICQIGERSEAYVRSGVGITDHSRLAPLNLLASCSLSDGDSDLDAAER